MKLQTKIIIPIIIFIFVVVIYWLFFKDYPEHKYQLIDLNDTISKEELKNMRLASDKNVLIFGFDLRRSVEEDTQQYAPFVKYLEKATEYKFKLKFTKGFSSIVDDLGRGLIHFAAIGANTYIRANEKYGVISLVCGLNKQNKAEYQSVLITSLDSKIKNINDLKGKRFAFGCKTSTQGHLIPRIIFAQHGLTLNQLKKYDWTGSHHNCADGVSSGRFDAGGMQDTLGRELANAGIIKIFFTSKYYPSSCIAVNKNVDSEIMAKVKKALIDFKPNGIHFTGLYHWDKTEMPNGFIEAEDKDYDELRKWIKKLNL